MRRAIIGACAILVATSQPAIAEEPAAEVAPVAPVQQVAVLEPAREQNILRSGTEVPLVIREELTTEKKKLRVGQRFQMEVASNIEMNGVIVIPAGTPATGEITEVRNKGGWGKSGYINARAVSLRLGARSVRLTGAFDDKGVTGTAGVVGAVALIPIAGFFMTGTSAKIPMGSGTKGFLDEDLAFRTVPVQPQVVDVPVAQPAPAAVSKPVAAEPAVQASGTAPAQVAAPAEAPDDTSGSSAVMVSDPIVQDTAKEEETE